MAAAPLTSTAPAPDEGLIELIRSGDEGAFEELYERYFKRIFNFVDKRLRNRADTEETVQEVFISVFNSIESYRGDAPFAAWIFGVTRRTIAGRFKKKRHPTVPLVMEDSDNGTSQISSPQSEDDPLELYEYRERLHAMQTLVATRLSKEQQKLFRMHHLQDRSIAEIATALDKSEDSIKSNLYRTRKILLAR